MFLVEIEGEQRKRHRRFLTQAHQHIEQPVTIFAAAQTHHHLVVRLDHRIIGDRLPDLPTQTLGEFVGFELLLLAEGGGNSVHEAGFYRLHALDREKLPDASAGAGFIRFSHLTSPSKRNATPTIHRQNLPTDKRRIQH